MWDKGIINDVIRMREVSPTLFSCEGHIYRKSIVSSYITVDKNPIFRYMVAYFNFGIIRAFYDIFCKYMNDFNITVEFREHICIRVGSVNKVSQKEWDDIRACGWNKVFEMLEHF